MEVEAGPSRSPEDVKPPNDSTENGTNGTTGEDGLPPNASETLYVHNLNEKVRIPGES